MKRTIGLVTLLVGSLLASPAVAWDPPDDGWSPLEPDPEPAAGPVVPDPAPFVLPEGLYYVRETYVREVVTTSGPLTTYATETAHESTGSYARVVDTVGSGASSVYDGAAFNGRLSLSDGRPVAGTYYENFVLTSVGFASFSVVFFADDAELARSRVIVPPPDAPVVAPPLASGPPAPIERPLARTPPASAPALPPPNPRGGVAVVPGGPSLARVEVLRGRRVALWPHVEGAGRLLGWRVFGDVGETSVTSGDGAHPFITEWERLAPPGEAWSLRFLLDVDVPPEATSRSIVADTAVVVRSPALEW